MMNSLLISSLIFVTFLFFLVDPVTWATEMATNKLAANSNNSHSCMGNSTVTVIAQFINLPYKLKYVYKLK